MAGLNKVLLIGNVGGDPEIRTLANGAIYILTQKGLKFFEKKFDNKKDFTKNYLPIFINKSAVYLTKSHFDDIGSEEVYQKYI